MWLTAAFTEDGSPKTGLTPSVTVYNLADDSVVINAQSMSEVANGIYKYNFSTIDETKDYSVYVDGGAAVPVYERYLYGVAGGS